MRPPLRLIVSQDVPASGPMILCVSDVIWPKERSEDGSPPHPEIEVTDGWYRLRARIDEPLARAVRKGILCAGKKIAIAGAKVYILLLLHWSSSDIGSFSFGPSARILRRYWR